MQGRVGRRQCWGAARSNLPIIYSHMQKGTSLFSVHFIKLSKGPHPLPLITTRTKKQHHYLLPPDLRWEGSSVYLFALITNYLIEQTKKNPLKNARVEPGSPGGLPLSKTTEEVGIIADSPTNIRTWPSTHLCLGRPGTLKRAHILIRVACQRMPVSTRQPEKEEQITTSLG